MKCSYWLLAVALVIGCADADKPECVQICQAAAGCGMLPSALGIADDEGIIKHTAIDNCEHRCANSSGRTIQQLATCIDRVSTSDDADNWCMLGCDEVANCFEQVFEDSRVTGSGRVQVSFTTLSDKMIDSALACGKTAEVPDTEDLDVEALCGTPEDVMESPVIGRVEVLLENSEDTQVLVSGTCSEVLASSFSSDLVAVGRYQLAIRLYRSTPSDTDGVLEESCHKFYGDTVEVSAGADVCDDGLCVGRIPLPSEVSGDFQDVPCMSLVVENYSAGLRCENDVETCADAKDQDCDQLSDCNDPSCAALCGEAEAETETGTGTESGTDSGTETG